MQWVGQTRVLLLWVVTVTPFKICLSLNTSILGQLLDDPSSLHLAFLKQLILKGCAICWCSHSFLFLFFHIADLGSGTSCNHLRTLDSLSLLSFMAATLIRQI